VRTDQTIDQPAAERRIKQLETELARRAHGQRDRARPRPSRKPLPGDRRSDRVGQDVQHACRPGVSPSGYYAWETDRHPRASCGVAGWPQRSPTSIMRLIADVRR
jgi:hypothetical protein